MVAQHFLYYTGELYVLAVQVSEFPSELILLGRATVMIRGIANRLGISWGLAERWAKVAQVALDATGPEEILPIWSVVRPTVATTADAAAGARVSGMTTTSMKDVRSALVLFARALQVW